MMNTETLHEFDPTFSNIERFEAENGFEAFDCDGCNDTGYDYDNYGKKIPCTCSAGRRFVAENTPCSLDTVTYADEDYDPGYDYDEWN